MYAKSYCSALKVIAITFPCINYSFVLLRSLQTVSTTLTSTSPTKCTLDKTIIQPIGSPFTIIGVAQYDFTCSYCPGQFQSLSPFFYFCGAFVHKAFRKGRNATIYIFLFPIPATAITSSRSVTNAGVPIVS